MPPDPSSPSSKNNLGLRSPVVDDVFAKTPQCGTNTLVRTSTLQTHPNNTGSGSSFNPYGIYPHTSKAVLNIKGNLDSVAAAPWSPEEVENRRK